MELKKRLHDNVYYYTNIFDNPKDLVRIIEELESDPDSYEAISPWLTDFSARKRKDLFPDSIKRIQNKETKQLVETVITAMQQAVIKIAYTFVEDRNLNITPNISKMLDVCKYEPGGSIGLHFDGQDGDRSLLYTIVMYFNDEQKGGEVSFTIMDTDKQRPGNDLNDPNIDFWIKPEAGSALVFPSTHPYLHQSHPVTSGNKYMSTSFIFVDGYDHGNPEHVKKYRNKTEG
jgi:hypothetical protein